MPNDLDYKTAIGGAKSFRDILAVFIAMGMITGEWTFEQHERRQAAARKVRESLDILESGTDDVEARYFALSQVKTMVGLTGWPQEEQTAVWQKYGDEASAGAAKLLDFYSEKGAASLKETGVHDDLAEYQRIGEELEKSKALLDAELQKISDEYEPSIVEADQRFCQPILGKMQSRRERYNREISDLYAKAIEDREAWQKELDDLQATYRRESDVLSEEYETALKSVQAIKNAMYEKKKAKTQEMGPSAELKAKQDAIAKEIHANLLLNKNLSKSKLIRDFRVIGFIPDELPGKIHPDNHDGIEEDDEDGDEETEIIFEAAAAIRTPITESENIQRGRDAMKRVISQHVNEPKAMFRKDLGWIAFYWGKAGTVPPEFKKQQDMLTWWKGIKNKFGLFGGGYGVSHIIAKRDWEGKYIKEFKGQKGEDIALRLVDVVAKGNIVSPKGSKRITIRHGIMDAILDSKHFQDEQVWLVSGLEIAGEYKLIFESSDDPGFKVMAPAYADHNSDYRHGLGAYDPKVDDIINQKHDNVKPVLESAAIEALDWRETIRKATSFDDIEDAFAAAFGPVVIKKFVNREISDLEKKMNELRTKAAKYFSSSSSGEVRGSKTTAFLNDNSPIELQYTVLEAGKLITSHGDEMSVNQEFSQDLQPRDRSREGMKLQVDIMAGKLNPERLGESTSVSTGAPIIGQDMTVESGNGRTIAIRKAYALGDKGREYKQWLIDNSADFGIPADAIEKMQRPVLVRIRLTEIDRAEFARKANEDEIAQMSPAELARADAAKLTDDDVALFEPSEDGNMAAASNRPFITRFFERMGQNAATGYMTKDGKFTKQLIDRVQAAIFSKAYQDDYLLELMAEDADPRIKNILSAMTIAAGEFSRAKAIDPTLMGIDIPRHVIGAAKIIKKAREDGQEVDEALSQTGLFEEVPEDTKAIALFIDKNIRSARRMGDVLKESAKILRRTLIDEKEPKLLDTGDPLPTAAQIVAMAIEKERESREASLFEAAKDFDWKTAIMAASSFSDIEAVFQRAFPAVAQLKDTVSVAELLSKPPVRIAVVKKRRFTDTDIVKVQKEAKQILEEEFKKLENGAAINRDSGMAITSTKSYIAHATHLKHRHMRAHMEATVIIPVLLQNAIVGETHEDTKNHDPDLRVHRLFAPFTLDEKLYRAKMTIMDRRKRTTKGEEWTRFYDHALTEIEEIEKPATEGTNQSPESDKHSPNFAGLEISIATLLKNARKNDGTLFIPEESKADLIDPIVSTKLKELRAWYLKLGPYSAETISRLLAEEQDANRIEKYLEIREPDRFNTQEEKIENDIKTVIADYRKKIQSNQEDIKKNEWLLPNPQTSNFIKKAQTENDFYENTVIKNIEALKSYIDKITKGGNK